MRSTVGGRHRISKRVEVDASCKWFADAVHVHVESSVTPPKPTLIEGNDRLLLDWILSQPAEQEDTGVPRREARPSEEEAVHNAVQKKRLYGMHQSRSVFAVRIWQLRQITCRSRITRILSKQVWPGFFSNTMGCCRPARLSTL